MTRVSVYLHSNALSYCRGVLIQGQQLENFPSVSTAMIIIPKQIGTSRSYLAEKVDYITGRILSASQL